MTSAQARLVAALQAHDLVVQPEWRFHDHRRWRIDVAAYSTTTPRKLAIEIDGGVWVGGRHTRGAGVLKDNEKIAHLAIDGWLFLRVTPQQVNSGQALAWALAILFPSHEAVWQHQQGSITSSPTRARRSPASSRGKTTPAPLLI